MLVHDHIARDGESLARAPSDLLGCKEGIEDTLPDRVWDTASRIRHLDDGPWSILTSAYGDPSFALVATANNVADGVGGVHDHIQNGLIEVAGQAHDGR